MTQTLLAWNSGPAWHWLGTFVVSSGFGGAGALVAASIAAYQVQKTRKQDTLNKQRDALWDRFQWVIDQIRTDTTGKRTLNLADVTDMLEAMKTRVDDVKDPHLKQLIGQVQTSIVKEVLAELTAPGTGRHHKKDQGNIAAQNRGQ